MLFKKTVLLLPCLLLMSAAAGWADIPQVLNYQGKITDSAGEPLSDGQYDVTFSLWNAVSGGSSLWSETQTGVTVSDGILNALLGSVTPIPDSAFSGADRYLQIDLAGESVTPRIQLTSVGYSFRVATVDGATGGTISAPLIIVPKGTAISAQSGSNRAAAAGASRIEIGFTDNSAGSISLFEPVDSERGLSSADNKRIEIRNEGLIMFGASEFDTTLVVEPNGDIRGVGQITMGQNSSDGTQTTVLGFQNTADGDSSTIGGGSANLASGAISVIAGGHQNTATNEGSTIGGGSFNDVNGQYATIGGGQQNVADGDFATVGGGFSNSAGGSYATIPGGNANLANGMHSYSAGHRAQALHNGAFVWADQTDADFQSTGDDQFIVRATGGVGIGTNSPVGVLDVTGMDGDTSVNLPSNSIAAPEILDEPGLASNRATGNTTLTQGDPSMQELVSVTISIPAPGYVSLRGQGTFESGGTTSRNQIEVQIAEAPGGGYQGAYAAQVGSGDHDSPNSTHYFAVAAERIFFKEAGTYSFVFEARAHPLNGASAVSVVQRPSITATYYPTSYGQVTEIVSAADAASFQSTSYVGSQTGEASFETPVYEVDLRELELKAIRTRLEAEQAERELLEAMLR